MGQLWDLWVRWWSGEKVDGAHLWGLPVLACLAWVTEGKPKNRAERGARPTRDACSPR